MKRADSNKQIPQLLDFILTFFVVILYLFAKIGDGVIWFLSKPGALVIRSGKLIPAGFFKLVGTFFLLFKDLFSFLLTLIAVPGKITLNFISKLTSLSLPPLKLPPPSLSLPKAKPHRLRKYFFSFSSFLLGILLTIVFVFLPYNLYLFLKSLPNPKLLTENYFPITTKIYDRNGNLLYEIYSEQNRTPVKLTEIPQSVIDATISIEDKEFYYHFGFSTRGITRALKSVMVDKKLQGGSTITQQLIKSALLTPERTVQRKIKEILLAFWAERLYSKDQLLEMYLNQVPYGGTAWGIQAASQTYFGKNVTDLTLAQSALLAGLPAAPTFYSPFGAHPENAEIRKNQVLEEMRKAGKISPEEFESTKTENLTYAPQITNIKAPHFVMYVKELLEHKYGIRKVEQGGLRVMTSLDLTLQEKAEGIVTNQIEVLKSLSVGNGAALITNPKTGEILAMVGSKNYFDVSSQGNVNITTSQQQPGSSIKVVTYTAALENGFTAASILDDSPITYSLPGQKPYSPVNYDGKFHGKIYLRKALGNSYNIPAVKVLAQISLEKMLTYGKNMGIESWTDPSRYGLSLTLGGGEVTMLDMSRVYATLADKGRYHQLNPLLKVTTYEGEVLEENLPAGRQAARQVIKEETAFILSSILSDNNARTDAFGPNSKLVIPGKTVAVKTGTSNDKRDNWAIGFTPSYVVTVWVGNNDNSPMNPVLTSGVTGATPIWNDLMSFLISDKADEPFSVPPTIVSLPCNGKAEYFAAGTQPLGGCPIIIQDTPTPTP